MFFFSEYAINMAKFLHIGVNIIVKEGQGIYKIIYQYVKIQARAFFFPFTRYFYRISWIQKTRHICIYLTEQLTTFQKICYKELIYK